MHDDIVCVGVRYLSSSSGTIGSLRLFTVYEFVNLEFMEPTCGSGSCNFENWFLAVGTSWSRRGCWTMQAFFEKSCDENSRRYHSVKTSYSTKEK
jgi:hypothetical protein